MTGSSVTVDAVRARSVCEAALRRAGVPTAHAGLQTDLLLEAELRGRASHGLLRLERIIERIGNGVTNPWTRGRLTWRRTAFLEVDGEDGLGPVVACAALEALSERVAETGIALAAVAHNNHLGMLAWYAERVAKSGRILVALSTSEALVHPWGGRRALLGTNPIAIGVPADPEPYVLDMATSLVAMGQIHDRAIQGRAIPTGWALDEDGAPTTDARAAMQGSLAPFGEAKGYGLGLAFGVLVAALTGSALGRAVRGTLDATHPCNKGDLFILIDPGGDPALAATVGAFLDLVRADPPAQGFARIAIPGDRAAQARARHLREGLTLAPSVWNRLLDLSEPDIRDREPLQ